MSDLQRQALASLPLAKEDVESFWAGSWTIRPQEAIKALCVSHERLRAELQGAEILLEEDKAIRADLLAACRELLPHAEKQVAWLDKLSMDDLYPNSRAAMLQRARAALARAEVEVNG